MITKPVSVSSTSLGLNNHAEISYHSSSGDTVPALFAEFLGKLIHPFGGWLTQGNTARQYPLAAMSEMFDLSIVVVETGALGRPV
jgi:hypothetical protein